MLKCLVVAVAVLLAPAAIAQGIEGQWIVSNGERVRYSACGAAWCSTIETGPLAGKTIGRLQGDGPTYVGTVVDPESDTSYEGRAAVEGDRLTVTGCVAKVFCRSQVLTR